MIISYFMQWHQNLESPLFPCDRHADWGSNMESSQSWLTGFRGGWPGLTALAKRTSQLFKSLPASFSASAEWATPVPHSGASQTFMCTQMTWDLSKMQALIQGVWGRAWEAAFLTSSPGRLCYWSVDHISRSKESLGSCFKTEMKSCTSSCQHGAWNIVI